MIQKNDPAKNFSLKDQDDKTFDLFEHSEKRVLLSFHPLAWTPFCAGQMKSLEDNRDVFSDLNTIVVGISVDSLPCKKAWAESLGITHTPLLCDFWPHGAVAHQYGLFREANGFSERANVLIDEQQKVRFVKVYPVHSVPDIKEIITVVRDL
jgi:peroxiredoxin